MLDAIANPLRAGCPIDDAGVAPIANLPDLENLWLSHTRITGTAPASFSDLPKLSSLDLNHTKVTDIGLARIGNSRSLVHLDIYDTQVTDSGLSAMTAMPIMETCKNIFVAGPKMSQIATEALRKKFPALVFSGPEQYARLAVGQANAKEYP